MEKKQINQFLESHKYIEIECQQVNNEVKVIAQKEGKKYIVKFIEFDDLNDLQDYYKILQQVKEQRHINMARIVELTSKESYLIYSEQYYHTTLQEYLNKRKINDINCYRIALGLLNGMIHLHQNKINHLNLKPNNVLLDEHYNVKISDILYRGKHRKDNMIYSPLEQQLQGISQLESDYFSVGALLCDIFGLSYKENAGQIKKGCFPIVNGDNHYEIKQALSMMYYSPVRRNDLEVILERLKYKQSIGDYKGRLKNALKLIILIVAILSIYGLNSFPFSQLVDERISIDDIGYINFTPLQSFFDPQICYMSEKQLYKEIQDQQQNQEQPQTEHKQQVEELSIGQIYSDIKKQFTDIINECEQSQSIDVGGAVTCARHKIQQQLNQIQYQYDSIYIDLIIQSCNHQNQSIHIENITHCIITHLSSQYQLLQYSLLSNQDLQSNNFDNNNYNNNNSDNYYNNNNSDNDNSGLKQIEQLCSKIENILKQIKHEYESFYNECKDEYLIKYKEKIDCIKEKIGQKLNELQTKYEHNIQIPSNVNVFESFQYIINLIDTYFSRYNFIFPQLSSQFCKKLNKVISIDIAECLLNHLSIELKLISPQYRYFKCESSANVLKSINQILLCSIGNAFDHIIQFKFLSIQINETKTNYSIPLKLETKVINFLKETQAGKIIQNQYQQKLEEEQQQQYNQQQLELNEIYLSVLFHLYQQLNNEEILKNRQIKQNNKAIYDNQLIIRLFPEEQLWEYFYFYNVFRDKYQDYIQCVQKGLNQDLDISNSKEMCDPQYQKYKNCIFLYKTMLLNKLKVHDLNKYYKCKINNDYVGLIQCLINDRKRLENIEQFQPYKFDLSQDADEILSGIHDLINYYFGGLQQFSTIYVSLFQDICIENSDLKFVICALRIIQTVQQKINIIDDTIFKDISFVLQRIASIQQCISNVYNSSIKSFINLNIDKEGIKKIQHCLINQQQSILISQQQNGSSTNDQIKILESNNNNNNPNAQSQSNENNKQSTPPQEKIKEQIKLQNESGTPQNESITPQNEQNTIFKETQDNHKKFKKKQQKRD